MRMLQSPFLSPFKASRRLEGGERRSSIAVAAWSWVSRITARARIPDGIRRDFPVAKKRSVSKDANERITKGIVNESFTIVKSYQRPRSSSNRRSFKCREVSSSFTRLRAAFTFDASSSMPTRNAARNSLGAFWSRRWSLAAPANSDDTPRSRCAEGMLREGFQSRSKADSSKVVTRGVR